jgi:hypothetical protein
MFTRFFAGLRYKSGNKNRKFKAKAVIKKRAV